MPLRVLVLGGTRFIGRRVVELLAAAADEVTVCSRASAGEPQPAGVRIVRGLRQESATLRSALGGGPYDVLLDQLAFDADDVAGLFAAGAATAARRYMMMSTAWVYAALSPGVEEWVSERDLPPGGALPPSAARALGALPARTRDYVAGKLRAEAAACESSAPVTVLRPCMVAGRGDHNRRVQHYADAIGRGGPLPLRDPSLRFQLAWVDDVAGAVVGAMRLDSPERECFNIAPERLTSTGELVELVARSLGREAPPIVPAARQDADPLGSPVRGRYEGSRVVAATGVSHAPLERWLCDVARGGGAPAGAGAR